MSMASEIYAKRRRDRAAYQLGGAPQPEPDEAPSPAPAADTFGKMLIYTMESEARTSNTMPDAKAIFAKRAARRAAWPAGSGETEE
ncbi:hypothetical protein [Mesorhizobium sp.]|uniref:hypothetical protein n=1 Tax=Mesorhizobium sp. TaxID=1871066 RepID=UPI000FE89C7F|nr:hypothetical protein [Mesorhizobium sp.]RWM08951.1 MAG: hypothetical protein EOR71_10580 [Mesorhizobium sp.]